MASAPSAAPAPLRALLMTGVRPMVVLAAMLVVYAVVPLDGQVPILSIAATAAVGLLVFGAVFVHQVSRIRRSSTPTLTAVEALVLVYGTFLIQFALLYVSLSSTDPAAFSEELNRVAGLYLSITVLSTVGFGDITAASDLARILVSFQMIADLVLIGTAVRILSTTVRRAVTATGADSVTAGG